MLPPPLATGTRGALLELIKRRGSITIVEAEAASGLSGPTLRQHLGVLERDGFVERSSHKQARGRPRLRYSLTPEGERLFPNRDGNLMGRLLDFLLQRGEDGLVEDFFEEFWKERTLAAEQRLAEISGDDVEQRLTVLANLLAADGFMPQVEVDGNRCLVRACNCPYPEAVARTRLPCRLEARFIQTVADERAVRVAYIPDGAPTCTYRIPLGEGA